MSPKMFLLIFLNIIHVYTTPYTMEGLNGRMAERKTQNRYEKFASILNKTTSAML